jgi:urease subunit gamma
LTLIKITVKGESDVPPFTRTFHYSSKADEEIFANLTNMVKDKLDHNLRININETITAFSALVVSELRGGKSIEQIQKDASILLKPEQVMIGVPETIQQMSFEVTLDDGLKRLVVLDTPIRISDYILKSA